MVIAEEQLGTVETCPRRGMATVVRPPWNPLSETESAQGGEAVGETRRCQRWIWRTKVTEKATGRPGCEPGSEKSFRWRAAPLPRGTPTESVPPRQARRT